MTTTFIYKGIEISTFYAIDCVYYIFANGKQIAWTLFADGIEYAAKKAIDNA